ncbi:MAG: hypothetical protein K2M30_01170 [Desulfovibrionaceae bacterium]|nr:hypothetical protein [Desulfovibrionaceae bacterium]
MLLSTFMEYALEGYGAVLKNGTLERVPMKQLGNTSNTKRKEPTKEENIQTIIAFINAVKKQHGELCSYLAMLLLVETIQKKEVLNPYRILTTYQSMLEIENVVREDYPYFRQLPLAKQKEYMIIMSQMHANLRERKKVSKAFLFQNLFTQGTNPLIREQ